MLSVIGVSTLWLPYLCVCVVNVAVSIFSDQYYIVFNLFICIDLVLLSDQ